MNNHPARKGFIATKEMELYACTLAETARQSLERGPQLSLIRSQEAIKIFLKLGTGWTDRKKQMLLAPSYAGRALAFEKLKQRDRAIEDCTLALKYDPVHQPCLDLFSRLKQAGTATH